MNLQKCFLVKCPHCGEKKEMVRLLSGDTTDAQFWSDNRLVTPQCLKTSPVQKCPHCSNYFFYDEAEKEVGEQFSGETGWLGFKEAVKANAKLTDLNEKQAVMLTMITVWAYNDYVRNGFEPSKEDYEWLCNYLRPRLEGGLFDNDLIRAELLREIGEYDECVRILSAYVTDVKWQKELAEEVMERAKQKDNNVFSFIDSETREQMIRRYYKSASFSCSWVWAKINACPNKEELDRCFYLLRKLLRLGFHDFERMDSDPSFDGIKDTKEFKALIDEFRNKGK